MIKDILFCGHFQAVFPCLLSLVYAQVITLEPFLFSIIQSVTRYWWPTFEIYPESGSLLWPLLLPPVPHQTLTIAAIWFLISCLVYSLVPTGSRKGFSVSRLLNPIYMLLIIKWKLCLWSRVYHDLILYYLHGPIFYLRHLACFALLHWFYLLFFEQINK